MISSRIEILSGFEVTILVIHRRTSSFSGRIRIKYGVNLTLCDWKFLEMLGNVECLDDFLRGYSKSE